MENNESVKYIKKALSDFIETALKSNMEVEIDKGDKVNLNKAIYEIQHHFIQELKERNINVKLNDEIYSVNILKSFGSTIPFHKPEEYSFRFLKFLHNNYLPDIEVHDYIDYFIDEIKEELTWQDLIITATGATRCKTNIRFSVNLLRKLSLVRRKNKLDKRSCQPSILGQLIIIYLDWINGVQNPISKPENSISIHGYNHFVSFLSGLLQPLNFNNFIRFLYENYPMEDEARKIVRSYMVEFVGIILKKGVITEDGIKISEELKNNKDYSLFLEKVSNDYFLILPPVRTMIKK